MNIILIGYMGTGKTTIGKELAAKLALKFIDSDAEIVAAAHCSIPEIFAVHGEHYFRSLESQTLEKILQLEGFVLATGGGIVTCDYSRDLLQGSKQAGDSIVWLKTEPEVILQRVKHAHERPLLQTDDQLHTIKTMLAKRNTLYANLADFIVDVDQSIEQIVEQIIASLS